MENYDILKDIAKRTNGDIYIGVVGPVRTGKSTFIKNFMDQLVIPNIDNDFKKERALDELPQSAGGKTIMTTEPKFIPNEAITINLKDKGKVNVRLIDSVGYVVNNALGYIEEGEERLVSTPWFPDPIPFTKAAEIGTEKVIKEHSTIGLIITTDGSIADIERENYVKAEERCIKELKEIGKPFVVLLNSQNPRSQYALDLKNKLEEKYSVPIVLTNCLDIKKNELLGIIKKVLEEFPVKEINFNIPSWLSSLPRDNNLKKSILEAVKNSVKDVSKISDIKNTEEIMKNNDFIKDLSILKNNMGEGKIEFDTMLQDGLFYKIISENTGFNIEDDSSLLKTLSELSMVKKEYDKFSSALKEVEHKGYGVVSPTIDELTLEEPEIVKQGNKFGVRLKASAPSIQIIRIKIRSKKIC